MYRQITLLMIIHHLIIQMEKNRPIHSKSLHCRQTLGPEVTDLPLVSRVSVNGNLFQSKYLIITFAKNLSVYFGVRNSMASTGWELTVFFYSMKQLCCYISVNSVIIWFSLKLSNSFKSFTHQLLKFIPCLDLIVWHI